MKWLFWIIVVFGCINVLAIGLDWISGDPAPWWVWLSAIALYPVLACEMWRDLR